jgi:ElaB/YqjD/DUF883 family membrane-anchored ribosome-binding protein
MSRNRELEREVENALNGASRRVRHYAGEAADTANTLVEQGRRLGESFGKRANGRTRRARYLAEDIADEANYQYRRMRRQVSRNPLTSIGIAAAAIGTFLLIRHALRTRDED